MEINAGTTFKLNIAQNYCILYHLDLISSPKDYVEILDGIMPIEKGIGLFDGIIGINCSVIG